MSIERLATILALVLVVTGGCTLVDKGRLIAAEGVGRAVVTECALSKFQRNLNLEAVNLWLLAGEYPHRAKAPDCDGDGTSDF